MRWQKEELEKTQRRMNQWIKADLAQINAEEWIGLHEKVSKKTQKFALRLVIESLASVDGVTRINKILQDRLGMTHVEVNLDEVSAFSDSMLTLRILILIWVQCRQISQDGWRAQTDAITGKTDLTDG
jgi:hypothetical protein